MLLWVGLLVMFVLVCDVPFVCCVCVVWLLRLFVRELCCCVGVLCCL